MFPLINTESLSLKHKCLRSDIIQVLEIFYTPFSRVCVIRRNKVQLCFHPGSVKTHNSTVWAILSWSCGSQIAIPGLAGSTHNQQMALFLWFDPRWLLCPTGFEMSLVLVFEEGFNMIAVKGYYFFLPCVIEICFWLGLVSCGSLP